MIDARQIPSPCFVLDAEAFRRNLSVIRTFQKDAGVCVTLALKGFAMHSVFPWVREVTPAASASSLNEVRLADEFFDSVHAYAPAYIDDDFDAIADMSEHITFNSIAQFDRFGARARNRRLALRVNPLYSDVKTKLYNPCSLGSRLGVHPDVLLYGVPRGISGLHIHNLCESRADSFVNTLVSLERHCGASLKKVEWLNLGGGHLVTAQDYDIGKSIHALLEFRKRYSGLEVFMEPGAAWAWRTGVLVSTVLDIVQTNEIPVVMLDVSFTNHMPDTLEMPYLPDVQGTSVDGAHTYRLGGCSCLAGDSVGPYAFEAPLEVGQKLVFMDMMHYTMVKTTMFNGLPLPSIGIWDNGRFERIASFGYDDYKSRLS